MNVANKELCQELYTVSEWDDTDCYYGDVFTLDGEHSYTLFQRQDGVTPLVFIPAYDLDYLLRKLQLTPTTEPDIQDEPAVIIEHSGTVKPEFKWCAKVFNGNWYESTSSIPKDAAAKLALELFKQGVLQKEND